MFRITGRMLAVCFTAALVSGTGQAAIAQVRAENLSLHDAVFASSVAKELTKHCEIVKYNNAFDTQVFNALSGVRSQHGYVGNNVTDLSDYVPERRIAAFLADYIGDNGIRNWEPKLYCKAGLNEINKGSAIGGFLIR